MPLAKNDAALAPIAIFAYNRPEHLRRLLASLELCPEFKDSQLRIFVDGPKGEADRRNVDAVREIASSCSHPFLSLSASPVNKGLAKSVIEGVSESLRESESVIVLEDDLEASPFLLKYMNEALALYSGEPLVASIHAYVYPVDTRLPETFFLRGADCWGWATWRRAWRHFEHDGAKLLKELQERRLVRSFDLDGACGSSAMLRGQILGMNDSWAIRWHASAFLAGMLTLYPGRPLVLNTGNDGSGANCSRSSLYFSPLAEGPVALERLELKEDSNAREAFKRFFKRSKPSAFRRLLRFIKRNLGV